MWALMHKRGCGRPAVLRKDLPARTDPITPDGMYHLDGTPIGPAVPRRCESCGKFLGGLDLNLDYFVGWPDGEPGDNTAGAGSDEIGGLRADPSSGSRPLHILRGDEEAARDLEVGEVVLPKVLPGAGYSPVKIAVPILVLVTLAVAGLVLAELMKL